MPLRSWLVLDHSELPKSVAPVRPPDDFQRSAKRGDTLDHDGNLIVGDLPFDTVFDLGFESCTYSITALESVLNSVVYFGEMFHSGQKLSFPADLSRRSCGSNGVCDASSSLYGLSMEGSVCYRGL